MTFLLSIFSVYIAPIIIALAWIVILIRIRSKSLAILSILLLAAIMLTTFNAIFILVRNPYIMLTLLFLVLLNLIALPYMTNRDRPYLIAADMLLIAIIAALHLWWMFIRQSTSYFYEQSDYWSIAFPSVLILLSLCIPIVAIMLSLNKDQNRQRIALPIGLALTLGLLSGFLF